MTDQADTELATLEDAAQDLPTDEQHTPETIESETPEGQEAQAAEGAPSVDAQADDEVVVSFGDEAPPASEDDENRAPAWVKDLRRANREKDRRIRELEQRLNAGNQQAEQAVVVGAKPDLGDPDIDYDQEKYDKALLAWHARQLEAEQQKAKKVEAEKAATDAWVARVKTYEQAKASLKVPDFQDAEDALSDALSVTQQGVILSGAEKPELLVYALGKAPAKLKELAAITDPVKFAFAVAKLETQLKVQPRKQAPAPERRVTGSVPVAGVDQTLARLEAEAEKTGDRTKVVAFKRQQRMSSK